MLKDPVRKAALASGIALTLLGILLLLITQNLAESMVRWSPSILTVFGAFLLYRAWFRKARPSALFLGLLMFFSGTFILLMSADILPRDLTLQKLWPVFMGIVGVSLIPYGARYRRTVRVTLVVPGIILILLMAVFLLFSFSVVKQSFAEFVRDWWPLVLVFMGVTLVASAWVGKKE